MIQLGNLVRDKVTGFQGIVTAKVDYLSGCLQFAVAPPAKDDKLPDAIYFDYQRLEVIGAGVALPSRDAGGDSRNAPPARETH